MKMTDSGVTQTVFGDLGNCFAACIAIVVGCDLDDVPQPGPEDSS